MIKNKIIFFSAPAFGHLNAVYPIIKMLVENGYLVDWYCTEKYKELIEKTGANFIKYSFDFDYKLDELTSNFYNLFKGLIELNRKCYLEYIDKVKECDLIIYDSMCSFAKNISKKINIKSVCVCTTLAYNKFTFVFSNMFFSTIRLIVDNFFKISKLIKDEKKFRSKYNIIKFNIMDFFVNSGDITLVLSPKEFQPFYRTFPKSFNFVGTTIKERIRDGNKKYDNYDLYISWGSIFRDNSNSLNDIIKSNLAKNKKIIINSNNFITNDKNIKVVDFVEQISLLPNIDIFLNHGGINSIYEAIYFGKFQICFPKQEEQKMNAKIVKRKRIGLLINNLYSINKKLNRNKYSKNINKYMKIIREYDGTKISFNIIDKFLNK